MTVKTKRVIHPINRMGIASVHRRADALLSGHTSHDSLKYFRILKSGTRRFRVMYSNFCAPASHKTETDQILSPITVSFSIPFPSHGQYGAYIRGLFNGASSAVIAPGGAVISDWVYLDVSDLDYIYIKTRCETSSSANNIPIHTNPSTIKEGYVFDGASSLVPNYNISGYTTNTGVGCYAPDCILCDDDESTLFVGDSITAGYGDSGLAITQPIKGWPARNALLNNKNAFVYGFPGLTTRDFCIVPDHFQYSFSAISKVDYKKAVISFGSNDCYQYSYADVVAGLTKLVGILRTLKIEKVYMCTICPRTTSTDSFATVENQTPVAGFEFGGVRDQVNTWMQTSTLFDGIIDIRSVVESKGVWVPSGTTDGIHPTSEIHSAIASHVTIL